MNERDLVFIGGGHAHALVLRMLAMKPIQGVRLTLISETMLTPYSGMLPGYLAGHYSLDETHIDLNKLCRATGVRFIHDSVTGINLQQKTIQLKQHPDLQYDKVSINTGSTPNLNTPGAAQFALGVKPISQLTNAWHQLLAQPVSANATVNWAVVGAGAAGVEVALAIAHRFKQQQKPIQLSLVYSGTQVLAGYNPALIKQVNKALTNAGIQQVAQFNVAEVKANALISTSGQQLATQQSIWCTPANAPAWPRLAGLAVDERGFIAVNQFLQSTSHPDVFAAGDVAAMMADPRPKAGVFAVRSAPFLTHNLRASFGQQTMRRLKLQRSFLSLIALGGQTATGQRFGLSFTGRWVWRLKNTIDQRFMALFGEQLPSMTQDRAEPMHCAGCGSKLGPELLAETLTELNHGKAMPAEDASIAFQNDEQQLWQSLDGFRSFTSDDYQLGKIICHHAVNDCYAMGIKPNTAQVWANLAFSHPRLAQRDFKFLMHGVLDALKEHDAKLIGGHSTQGQETHIGLVVNGLGKAHWPKNGLQNGDWILLNRPIGSGILLAANQQGVAHASAVQALWCHLLNSNKGFFTVLQRFNVHAATDITGFGLVGHLLEMTDNTELAIELHSEMVPFLPDALTLSAQGFGSTLLPQLLPLQQRCEVQLTDTAKLHALFDPQTQGGIAISVPANLGQLLIEQNLCVKIATVVPRTDKALIIQ